MTWVPPINRITNTAYVPYAVSDKALMSVPGADLISRDLRATGKPSFTTFPIVGPLNNQTLNAIKIAILYLDKVVLRHKYFFKLHGYPIAPAPFQQIRIIATMDVLSNSYLKELRPLIRAGLLEVESPCLVHSQQELYDLIKAEVQNNNPLMFREYNNGSLKLDDEIFDIHHRYFGPIKARGQFAINGLNAYYIEVLSEMATEFTRGQPVVTCSVVAQRFFRHFLASGIIEEKFSYFEKQTNVAKFGQEILKAHLLDVSALSFEQIVEARTALNDELAGFRAEIEAFHTQLSSDLSLEEMDRFGAAISREKLGPRLAEVRRKIETSKLKVLEKLLKIVKKPGSYIPLALTYAGGQSPVVGATISALVAATEIGAALRKEKLEAKNNNLIYLLNLQNRLGKS